ncbi:MAG: peptidyl-prolyl cis-trans isomerase D [Paraglaciecola sp.]|jgi:peptidyl-prolyl cis-trans isomerase D
MLERIREGSQGVWPKAILGLVVLSFVFAGVGSYINSSAETSVAKVNDETISQATLERAYQNERARMESQFGDAFSALAADSAYLQQFKQGILDRLIGEKLLEQTANDLGLRVSDAQIKQAIVAMPEFQFDGKFDNERYLAVLRQAGFQPEKFRDYMRTDMTRKQLSSGLLATEFTLPSESQLAYLLQEQTRDGRYLQVPAAHFKSAINVSQDDIAAYYQRNITQFDTEQKVSLDYVELQLADLLTDINVSEDDVQNYYQQNMQEFASQEQRRVSHILFEFTDDEQATKTQAQNILAKVKAGEDFSELAQTYSTDTFSAQEGGDLGWITPGMMDPAFEDAVFALAEVDATSTLVKSAFGFHIVKLMDIKKAQTTPFNDVKDEILTKLKTRKAEEEFYGLQQRMAEVAFEVPDNLDEVAAIANKKIQTTELFTRNAPLQIANDARVLNAAFSNELLQDYVNSDVIELGDNHVIVVRVAKQEPQGTKSLDEVNGDIKLSLLAEKSQLAANTWAKEVLAQIRAGEDITLKLADMEIQWQQQQGVARVGSSFELSIVEKLFKLSLDAMHNTDVVDLNNGDVALVQLTKVNPASAIPDGENLGLRIRLASTRAQFIYEQFIGSLRAQAEITIY